MHVQLTIVVWSPRTVDRRAPLFPSPANSETAQAAIAGAGRLEPNLSQAQSRTLDLQHCQVAQCQQPTNWSTMAAVAAPIVTFVGRKVEGLAAIDDGKTACVILTSNIEGSVWDSQLQVGKLADASRLALSSASVKLPCTASTLAVMSGGRRVIAGLDDGAILSWSVDSEHRLLPGASMMWHHSSVKSLSTSAGAVPHVLSLDSVGGLALWNGAAVPAASLHPPSPGHPLAVTSASLVVNPGPHPAALVLVGRRDGSVSLLSPAATGFVARESVAAPAAACGSVTAAALLPLPRGGLAAVCGFEDGTAILLAASETSAPLKQLFAWSAHRLAVRCLDVTAVHLPEGDALCVVTGSDDTSCAACWLSASSGDVLQAPRVLVQHADYVTAVVLNHASASGSPSLPAASVLTASWDGTVRRAEVVM